MTTNLEKLRYHAHCAEIAQVEIELMESQAEVIAYRQQYGRMSRSDKTVLPDSYMAKNLLRDNHRYTQLVGTRNGHQAMVAMYSALIVAGVPKTAHGRYTADGEHFELKALGEFA